MDAIDFVIDATAGTIGGVVGVVSGSPLDVIKTRLQAPSAGGTHYAGGGSIIHCLAHTIRHEGVRALYKGSLAASIGQVPNNFLTFGVYGSVLRRLAGGDAEPTRAMIYAAGSASGGVQSIALAPFELVKVQQQVLNSERSGAYLRMTDAASAIYRQHGLFRGLMRGWVATAWRDAPTYGLYFLTYEETKRAYARAVQQSQRILNGGVPPPRYNEVVYPMWLMLAGGGLAGVVSWAFALPFDVMKSVIQASDINTDPRELRMTAVARRIYARDGVRGFFRGLVPCLVRAVPVNAITFTVYDMMLQRLQPMVRGTDMYSSLLMAHENSRE